VNHWPFILGAYLITLLGTVGLVAASYLAMRRAEAEANALGDRR
jgi:hypothetical protein